MAYLQTAWGPPPCAAVGLEVGPYPSHPDGAVSDASRASDAAVSVDSATKGGDCVVAAMDHPPVAVGSSRPPPAAAAMRPTMAASSTRGADAVSDGTPSSTEIEPIVAVPTLAVEPPELKDVSDMMYMAAARKRHAGRAVCPRSAARVTPSAHMSEAAASMSVSTAS